MNNSRLRVWFIYIYIYIYIYIANLSRQKNIYIYFRIVERNQQAFQTCDTLVVLRSSSCLLDIIFPIYRPERSPDRRRTSA